jgi:hypothetical protein
MKGDITMEERQSGRAEAMKRIAQIKREQARIRSSRMQFVMNKPKPRVKEI